MKAVRLLEYGGQLVFNDVPTPTIARDEILLKIKSTAAFAALRLRARA
jgi:NADPH:quinone reductase-like Zn-dependent oxidoreductase